MYRRLALLAAGVVLLGGVSVYGQQAVLSRLYGSGVHAYFSGDYATAHTVLTSAIDAGTKDPRCYYFRGLSYLQLGREAEARMDFEEGADLEAADVNKLYRVGRSLQRIQGEPRAMIEKYRREAQLEAHERAQAAAAARYEAVQDRRDVIVREQATAPPTPDVKLPAVPEPPPEPAAKPFEEVPAEEPMIKPEKPEPPPVEPGTATTEKPAEPNPFDATKPEAPVETPAEPSPFDATTPETPVEEPSMPDEAPAEPSPFDVTPPDKPEAPVEVPADGGTTEAPAGAKAGGVLDALFRAAGKAGTDTVTNAMKSATDAVPGGLVPSAPPAPDGFGPPGPGPGMDLPADKPAAPGEDNPFDTPAPAEPAPVEPAPAVPAPVEPAPAVPAPVEPGATTPAPPEPAPEKPSGDLPNPFDQEPDTKPAPNPFD